MDLSEPLSLLWYLIFLPQPLLEMIMFLFQANVKDRYTFKVNNDKGLLYENLLTFSLMNKQINDQKKE